MGKIRAYINDTVSELMTKVTWPTWKELNASAVVVMVSSLITALFIYAVDLSFKFIMQTIYGFFG